ncbi:MAG: hypothetical protein GTN36_04190 [Candidatus Aenigmarchaeota archaeon]|nr:hypothetical protein [Candidatus Aenigmarchaeota archaeon]
MRNRRRRRHDGCRYSSICNRTLEELENDDSFNNDELLGRWRNLLTYEKSFGACSERNPTCFIYREIRLIETCERPRNNREYINLLKQELKKPLI